MNKKRILYIVAACTLSFAQMGCSDLLDQAPQGELIDTDLVGGTYESEIFGMYAAMRDYALTSGTTALAIHSFRSEDAEKGSTSTDGAGAAKMYDEFNYDASDGMLQGYWSANYNLIHKVNTLLESMKAGNLTDGNLVNKAEALFFRAYCYFNLVRAFGEVPLIDFKINQSSDANIPKSSVSDIYALIDRDLTEAEKYLPRTWESKYIGRLTWGAARSLHARTYMMRNDWSNLWTAATDVINSGIYNLNTPFNDIFRESGENCSESIFELQCTATSSLPESEDIGSKFALVQGVRGSGEWNMGWGWNTPTETLANAFEAGDPRKDETLLYFIKVGESPSLIPANQPYNEKPVATNDVIAKYFNKKAYTNPTYRAKYTKFGFWFNIRLIRYADVVLMAAEAAIEQNNTKAAKDYLEMVRSRARGKNTNILPKVTTDDQVKLRNAIRQERRAELAMQFDRVYDLVRWGLAEDVLGSFGYQKKHALLPLPQEEIDKSNGVLKQNPDYL